MSEPATPPPAAPPPPDERRQFQVDRLAFFSDAIFAIAITLLVLNIRAPALVGAPDEHKLLVAAVQTLPRVVGFLLSFLVVGNYWRSHHRLFRWLRDHDPGLVTINLWLLIFVSFIPAPTAFFSDYPDYHVPLIVYASSLALVGYANAALWAYARRHPGLLDPAAPPLDLRVGAGRSLVIPAACAAAVLLSFAGLWPARLVLMCIPVWTRLYTRLFGRPEPASRAAPPDDPA